MQRALDQRLRSKTLHVRKLETTIASKMQNAKGEMVEIEIVNNNNNFESADLKQSNGNVCNSNFELKSAAQNEVDPKVLIPQLCNHFYNLGWASGTGGGLSIRQNGLIYCAPSGVQKERIRPEDMFVLDEHTGEILERPRNDRLKCSECLSLFMVAFKLRSAGCCIHSHSINANLITALHSKRAIEQRASSQIKTHNEFRIKNQEMIKGIKIGSTTENLNYSDTLVVPIIDNVLFERDLAGAMQEAVFAYPDSNAVLVRNHGVYVWGNSWQQAKSMAECYDYLFKLKLEAFSYGFDWVLDE